MERQKMRTEEEQERKPRRSRHSVGSKSKGLHWSKNFLKDNKDAKRGNIRRKKKRGKGVASFRSRGITLWRVNVLNANALLTRLSRTRAF